MPHSVTPEPAEDAPMADTPVETAASASSDSEGPTPEVVDAVMDGSDKENRRTLEDMFDDDTDDDQFASSPQQKAAAQSDSQDRYDSSYGSTRREDIG